VGLRGVNSELRSLSELMGMEAPPPPMERPAHRRPVFEAPKDDAPEGGAPEADEMPDGMRDAAFNVLAKDSELVKGDAPEDGAAEPEGDAEAPKAPAEAPPKAPAEEPPKAPAEEPPKDAAPAKPPAEKPAEKPAEEPKAAEPPAEKPPEEKPDEKPPGEPARWRIPMDTVFGRTPKSDLERYLKTIAATLQAQEDMDIEQASAHIDAVVGDMTKAGLLPPLRPDSSDKELDAWSDAAMARGLASVILDRA